MNKSLRSLLFVTCIILFCCGCENKTDPFEAVGFNALDNGLNKRVETYQDAVFPNLANQKAGNTRMYIDFSSGIYEAYKNNSRNSSLIKQVYGDLSGVIVFKLDNNRIEPLENPNSDLIGRQVVEANNYHGKYAPIKDAVQQIVDLNNDAILITDYEEYYPESSGRSEITDIPCFKDAFVKWLSKGNSIHFFVSDYKENNIDKHLYFTIFSCGNVSNSSIISKVESSLSALPRVDITSSPYKLSTVYGSEKTGGIFYDNEGNDEKQKNILDLKGDTYIRGLEKNNNFEFYEFGLDWKTIDELKVEYQKHNQFKDFFRKLYIDLSNDDVYFVNDLDVKVYDVTEDFTHFAKCNEALNHKPKIEKGSNGEDKFADEGNDEVALTCYNSNGEIKKDWVYETSQQFTENKEVFALNKELFSNNKKTDKSKIEIGTQFHPNYRVENITNPSGLLRVDILISDVEPNLENPKLDLFKWKSTTKGSENTALYESIKKALKDDKVRPMNKVIYSYYIKAL